MLMTLNQAKRKMGVGVRGINAYAQRPWIGKDDMDYIEINGKPIKIIGNATLRKDEWIELDRIVLEIKRIRLGAVADLESRGLVHNIANGMGTTVFQYEDMSDLEAAVVSMDGITRGDSDRPEFDLNSLPLPITHKDFHFNDRVLQASRTLGNTLDTYTAGLATMRVMEKLEDMLVNGLSTYTFGGGSVYGYTDSPTRNQVSLALAWNDSSATGATILADVIAMKQASIDARHYGPWVLYIPTAYETVIDEDYKAATDRGLRERIMAIEGIQSIKVIDTLAANNVLLVQMTPDVVRMVNGLSMTPLEWSTQGGMVHNFKIMTIQVPQIRADQDGRSGVTHLAA